MQPDFSVIDRQGVKLISVDCINRLGPYRAYYSTGYGGVSDMPGGCTMNLAMFKRCENDTLAHVRENFTRFANACGFSLSHMALHRETHEATVTAVTAADLPEDVFDRDAYSASDAQVTADASVALFVYAADCCTIMLVDPVHGVHGTTHCGWRNSVNGTIEAFIGAFERCGGSAAHAVAAIGPAISRAHYSVDAEAARQFARLGLDDCMDPVGPDGRRPIDLPGINRRLLVRAGLREAQVYVCPWCTYDGGGLCLPSYRRDQGLNAQLGGVLFQTQLP